jgi:2Fe-2S ferredoxin
MPRITFLPDNVEIVVEPEVTVLDAALDHGIPLNHNCGGNCACSTCHVIIESGFGGLNAISDDEAEMLEEADGLTDCSRLSCQCIVTDDLVVRIPEPP